MCIGVHTDMCIGMHTDMCIGAHSDIRIGVAHAVDTWLHAAGMVAIGV